MTAAPCRSEVSVNDSRKVESALDEIRAVVGERVTAAPYDPGKDDAADDATEGSPQRPLGSKED